MLLLRSIAAAAFLAALLPCQVEEVGEADVRGAESERRMKEGKGQRGEEGEKFAEENLTPEQRLARNVTSGAGAFCGFQVSVSPAKLMPGQSGTLKVLATLRGNTVLPSPAPIEMVGPQQQGKVTLGGLTPLPASPGRLAAAYVGRPVYDNYAVFEVPVTMAADAPLGSKHVAAVDMRFDLYDGNSAQPIGRFVDRVAMEIEVGRVADPEVRGMNKAAASPEPKPDAPAPTTAASEGGSDAGAPTPLAGRVLVADPAPAPPAPSASVDGPATDAPPPTVEESGGMPVLLLAGGAVAAVVVGLLLLRRK